MNFISQKIEELSLIAINGPQMQRTIRGQADYKL
jgi:hypothetical protein